MSDVDTTRRPGARRSKRWPERLGWMRTVLLVVQTIAVLVRVLHDLEQVRRPVQRLMTCWAGRTRFGP